MAYPYTGKSAESVLLEALEMLSKKEASVPKTSLTGAETKALNELVRSPASNDDLPKGMLEDLIGYEHPQLDAILNAARERFLPDGTPFPKNPTKAQVDAFNKQLLEDLD